jgi:hypothetical protein
MNTEELDSKSESIVSTIKKVDSEVDEYLCHQKYFHLSMKFGASSSVTLTPEKNHWVVTQFRNFNYIRQDTVNTYTEGFIKFHEWCERALKEENEESRGLEYLGLTKDPWKESKRTLNCLKSP